MHPLSSFSELVLNIYEMDPPMSDWFRLLPHALDGIANAAKVLCATLQCVSARHVSSERSFSKSRLLLSCDIIEINVCSFLPLAIDYETNAGL